MPTHGSLTKAGKVRDQVRRDTRHLEKKPRRKTTPIRQNRRKYYNKFLKPKEPTYRTRRR